jgi:hypothetical protein
MTMFSSATPSASLLDRAVASTVRSPPAIAFATSAVAFRFAIMFLSAMASVSLSDCGLTSIDRSPLAIVSAMLAVAWLRSLSRASVHSTAKPVRFSLCMMGMTSKSNTRPPTWIVAACGRVSVANMFRWCAGFLWKTSTLLPISVAMLNRGNSRLSSSSACCSNSASDLFK